MKNTLFFILAITTLAFSCKKLDSYQKNYSIDNGTWNVQDVQDFTVKIEDTQSEYHHYLLLRNNEDYPFSNIWVKVKIQKPGETTFTDSFLNEFILFDKNGHSFGEKQGTFWNYKLPLNHKRLNFEKTGEYIIRVQQVMREDDLEDIMNVGWIIEKK